MSLVFVSDLNCFKLHNLILIDNTSIPNIINLKTIYDFETYDSGDLLYISKKNILNFNHYELIRSNGNTIIWKKDLGTINGGFLSTETSPKLLSDNVTPFSLGAFDLGLTTFFFFALVIF